MAQFEKYHPILTAHYTLDWLTKARAIDVQTLDQQATSTTAALTTTAAQINQTMRLIFRDQQLIWGVTNRTTDQFVGRVGFAPIDLHNHQATLIVDLLADAQTTATWTELYQRLVAFATAELQLKVLTVNLTSANPELEAILTRLGFTPSDQGHYQLLTS